MNILVLNAGSSTLKCAVFDLGKSRDPLWKGVIDWGKGSGATLISHRTLEGHLERSTIPMTSLREAFEALIKTSPSVIHAAGHRIVHGGERFTKPTLITEEVRETIEELVQLAPLHNPSNLEGIEIITSLFPDIPQYAVFDTGYHATLSPEVTTYPIPSDWRNMGIRKYGFHGISHQYSAERAAEMLGKDPKELKVVTCHLGNGSSLAASVGGRCIDTTMGFTPLDGLMMGTRPGSLDPGILVHVLRKERLAPGQLDLILNNECGLLGVCGFSDMRIVLEEMDQENDQAKLAFEMYVHRLKGYVGSMAASLDGLDALVFTAGIGEHAPRVREAACYGLSHLGVALDLSLNAACVPDQAISPKGARVPVLVIQAREEYAIALACPL